MRLIHRENAELVSLLHVELDVARARFRLTQLLKRYSAGPLVTTRIVTALSEISSNAVRYGERGVMGAWIHTNRDTHELTIKVADEGPGVADVSWATADHNSSGGTLGLGLSGARKPVDRFELMSPLPQKDHGTLVTMKITWRAR